MSWQDFFGLLPALALLPVVIWTTVTMARKLDKSRQAQADSVLEQRKLNELLGKLLSQHDARLQKLEDERRSN